MASPIKLTKYQIFKVWLNKKTSLLARKRKYSENYLVLEKNILFTLIDGIIANLALIHFVPFSVISIISLGSIILCMNKFVLPWVTKIFSSINLVRINK